MTKRQATPLNLSGIDPYDPSGLGRDAGTADAVFPKFAPPEPASSRSLVNRSRRSTRQASTSGGDKAAQLGSARHAYWVALAGGLVWAGCFIAFVLGFQHNVAPLDYAPFQAVILAVLTVLPAAFLMFAAFAVRQGARLASETRAARVLASDLVTPAALAAIQAGGVLETVRAEINRAATAARSAQSDVASLREALAVETERLTGAAVEAQRTAHGVAETLNRERDDVVDLVAGLQTGARDISAAISAQSRLVAESSDLARSQLQEAEAALAARAVDLTASVNAAGQAAVAAGDHLARNTDHLDAAGAALAERLRHLEARLGEQRAGMAALVQDCNVDQDDIAARLESRRAQLVETIVQARLGVAELGDASGQSAEVLQELIATTARQISDLVHILQDERANLSQHVAQTRSEIEADLARAVAALAQTAHDAHQSTAAHAEQARQTAAAHIEAAKDQVEHLGELAFNAGQQVNQAFEARMAEARRLIEAAAGLVEDAGVRSASRIASGVGATRSAMDDLATALSDIDARLARLPEGARATTQALQAVVDRGVGDLAAAARRVAEETRAVDAAFQERVKRNYETLSEAVRLMSRVAPVAAGPAEKAPAGTSSVVADAPHDGAADALATVDPPRSTPDRIVLNGGRAPNGSATEPAGASTAQGRFDDRARHEVGQPSGAAAPKRYPEPAAPMPQTAPDEAYAETKMAEPGLRPRLKLTPTDSDAALKTVFDQLRNVPVAETVRQAEVNPAAWEQDLDEWTWRDLLASIDQPEGNDDALADRMVHEISALGIDANALLSRARLDEIVVAIRTEDASTARDSVRRLAPAAIRRLSRRVLTDNALRDQADRYVRRYDGLVRDAFHEDQAAAFTLLSSDSGRAYLLLDAAVGALR